jgi:hypothetical protein
MRTAHEHAIARTIAKVMLAGQTARRDAANEAAIHLSNESPHGVKTAAKVKG